MNTIKIHGTIGWDTTAREVANLLKNMSGDVDVEISSGGGSVFDGVDIFNEIKKYNRGKTTARISSIGASMGSYIPLACDEVLVHDNATYMIHNVSTFAWGDHRELRKSADLAEGLRNLLANEYVKKTSKSSEEILTMMDEETFIFGADIVAMGFADGVIDTESDKNEEASLMQAKITFEATMKETNKLYEAESVGEKMVAMIGDLKQMGENPLEATATVQLNKTQNKESEMTIEAQLAEANASLATANTSLDSLKAEKDTLVESLSAETEKVTALEAKLSDTVATHEGAMASKKEEAIEVVALAFNENADKETAMKMVGAENMKEANAIIMEKQESNGATSAQDDVEQNETAKLNQKAQAVGITIV